MKGIGLIGILLVLGIIHAYPQDSIVSIPDTAFLYALIKEEVDTNGDSLITYEEADDIISLIIDTRGGWGCNSGNKNNVASLTGIEAFTNLDTLMFNCSWLSALSLPGNTKLRFLMCAANELESLDISNNIALETLICRDNGLTSLDVSKNTSLRFLDCSMNPLTSLDISNNKLLTSLGLWGTDLGEVCVWDSFNPDSVEIDTEASPNVYFTADCGANNVHIPDDAFLRELIREGVDINEDKMISFAEAADVKSLCVAGGGISDLTGIETFINLETLFCGANHLTSLDFSKNTVLSSLRCDRNHLEHLDISGNDALIGLNCDENYLTMLDVSGNTALQDLRCSHNRLTSLNVSGCTGLSELYCNTNQLTSLDVSDCTVLTMLWCGSNPIESLDISQNTSLRYRAGFGFTVGLNLSDMPGLHDVCVWTSPFPPDSVYVSTEGSPNVNFTTECITGPKEKRCSSFSIYPNPTYNFLTIESDISDIYQVEIRTLNGQQLLSVDLEEGARKLDLSPFPPGVYFISVRSESFVSTRKIIKL